MNTKNLDTFISVSKYASINAAAEALFISPPALQQQLNRLEKEIGFRLLDRTPGGIRMTPAGAAFLDGVVKMRSGMEQLLTHCRELDSLNSCIRLRTSAAYDFLIVYVPTQNFISQRLMVRSPRSITRSICAFFSFSFFDGR